MRFFFFFFFKYNIETTVVPQTDHKLASYLFSTHVGAGPLSPDNDMLQLYDRGKGGDDNDDESEDGNDIHDDYVFQHIKDPAVVQIESRGHHFVHRSVGYRVNGQFHVHL